MTDQPIRFSGLAQFIRTILYVWGSSFFLFSCQPEEEKVRDTGYMEALQMMQAAFEDSLQPRAKDVKIGILDIGFRGLDRDPDLSHLQIHQQIKFLKNYPEGDQEDIFKYGHGKDVLKYLSGVYPDDTVFWGSLARDAHFYLSRVASGMGRKEDLRSDELNIDSALKDMDSLGVRLVNISLGFWDEYVQDEENYTRDQMDGKTTVATLICEKWASRGMILVTAAGNTGEYAWKVIWAPADAQHVISVGAARFNDKVFKASYSGTGNPEVNFIKPDVISYSPWGTSFSTPVITGLIASMLQEDSALSLTEIKEILYKSATLYPYPNNYVGYGVPNVTKIKLLLKDKHVDLRYIKEVHVKGRSITLSASVREVVVFQKENPYIVKSQRIIDTPGGTITLKRKNNIPRTTVVMGLSEAYEIFWD